jgi:hypothetical protein
MKRATIFRGVVAAVLAALCVLSLSNQTDRIIDALGRRGLAEGNDSYLTESFNKAVKGFAVMSLLKAGLDIVEGSEVGASLGLTANVEIGDVVQPAYDCVDIAWRTVLIGAATLLGTKYLLQTAEALDSYVLGAAFLVALLLLLAAWLLPTRRGFHGVLRDILSVAVVAALALYFLLPVSVWGGSRLSRAITAPAMAEAEEGFRDTQASLFPDSKDAAEGWVGKLNAIQEKIGQIARHLKEKGRELVVWTVKLIAGYVFDCIIFPVGLFVLLLWLIRATTSYLFQRSFQRSLRDELARIFALHRSEAPQGPSS